VLTTAPVVRIDADCQRFDFFRWGTSIKTMDEAGESHASKQEIHMYQD
jgi:hypothetical protein